ncbi:class I adenylate-forming enzyme family protein [Pseudohalioglobus lutimaris]|uniref:class I adenylate-forming enzyme family protein n=1 Tax=Pseudohalioglobus lutimaris TaxID=1737061 RepID=UPI0013FE39C5|nr:class I adenylate-forming enzyme family protein [Pseudohalioglobus lutimaris]
MAECPERLAFIQGDHETSFSELAARTCDYQHHFRSLGIKPGDRVLVWTQNHAEIAAAVLGTWGEGAIVALMDASYSALQLQRALAVLEPSCIVHKGGLPPTGIAGECCTVSTDEVPTRPHDFQFSGPSVNPAEPASVVFTSGSTGGPRGVTQSHRNLVGACAAVYSYLGYQQEDRILCPVPWSFDYGFGQLLTTLLCGLTQILPVHSNPFGIGEAITQHRPTVLAGTPTVYGLLTGAMSPIEDLDVASIRLLTSSGGKMPAELLATLALRFPAAALSLNYGLTETYRSCYLPVELADKPPGTIGRPIPGVDIAIIGADGSPVETGEVGEIIHRGKYIMLGYWNDPDSTDRVLKPDPIAEPGEEPPPKALFTGDLGYRDDDGLLHFVGRFDHQLKSMGVKVNPVEVESILLELQELTQAAVFGVEHDILGDEIWAACVPVQRAQCTPATLRLKLLALMSPYMLPRQYLILDELPKNINGKVDYCALREMARQRYRP